MDSLKDDNIKKEEVCRTCLTDDGHFFNITDTFDNSTLTLMIQNITNLQINPSDGYTQSICFECVKEVRRAHKFRIKCLESNNTLIKINAKTLEVPIRICKIELPESEEIKQEMEDNRNIKDHYLDTEYDCQSDVPDVESDCEDSCIENQKQNNEDTGNENKNNPTTIFDCPLCHGLFAKDYIYRKHINEFHPDRLDDECFNQKREPLGYIFKNCSLKKNKHMYKCVLDEFIGNKFIEFKNHMREHTDEKPVVCTECGFRTTEMSLLKIHRLQKHIEEKRFSCSLCDYTCQIQNALKKHLAIHSTEKNYKCKFCPMAFKFASGLSVHKKAVHDKRKPHVCSVCQRAFIRSTGLRDHMRTHTGERPHVCHYCGMGFSKAENMRTHVTLQHEPIKNLFECDRCDYSTKRKIELKNHIKRHNGEKSFKCPQCPFSTLLKYSLKLHMKKHTGQEKNFACDLCDYKSISPAVIKIHRRIHTGEKPYSCNICNYSSKTQHGIKTHMQTHSSEQNFECPNCPYKTNVKNYLTRHLKKKCVIKKKGRPPSKHLNIPEDILINNEIKEDFETPINILSSSI